MNFWSMVIPVCLTILYMQIINGQNCTMTDYQDTKCLESDLDDDTQTGHILKDCKDKCVANSSCKATQLKGDDCFFAFKTFTLVPSTGNTLSIKQCSDTSTTATTTTTTAAVSQGTCTWSRVADSAGSNPAITIQLVDYDSCEATCFSVGECLELAYNKSSNTCKLYTSTTTPVSAAGNIFGTKIQCPSGCCYERYQDKTGGNNQMITFDQSLDSCEDLCYILTGCKAISFTGKSCLMFTESPRLAPKPGSTTSLKNCSAGGMSPDLQLTTVCLSGSTIQPVILFVLLMTATSLMVTEKS